jgi:hypothetical protein
MRAKATLCAWLSDDSYAHRKDASIETVNIALSYLGNRSGNISVDQRLAYSGAWGTIWKQAISLVETSASFLSIGQCCFEKREMVVQTGLVGKNWCRDDTMSIQLPAVRQTVVTAFVPATETFWRLGCRTQQLDRCYGAHRARYLKGPSQKLAVRGLLGTSLKRAAWSLATIVAHQRLDWWRRLAAAGLSAALAGSLPLEVAAISGGGLDYAGQQLSGQDLSRQKLTQKDFSGAICRGTSFAEADLSGARFFKADLTEANLHDAQLIGASLEQAVLRGSVFQNAVLRATYWTESVLQIGDLKNSDWTDALLEPSWQVKLCAREDAQGTNPHTNVSTRESLMCPD